MPRVGWPTWPCVLKQSPESTCSLQASPSSTLHLNSWSQMTLPSLSNSQKRNFSVTAQLLLLAKLEMPRSRNYIASFSPQCLSQCLLSALAKQPQNNTTQINISPSIGQAASISLSANPCLFVPQSLPHSHLGLLQRGQVPTSLHLIHWTLMLSWAKQHNSAPPYHQITILPQIINRFLANSI